MREVLVLNYFCVKEYIAHSAPVSDVNSEHRFCVEESTDDNHTQGTGCRSNRCYSNHDERVSTTVVEYSGSTVC